MKIIFIFILSFISLFGINTFATITISAVSNASNSVDLTPEEGLIEILAGVSGRGDGNCNGAVTTTIDTCALQTQRGSCNFNTVCSSTKLNISLSSDSQSGTIKIIDSDNQVFFSEAGYTSGSTKTINVQWSDICNAVTGDSGCGTSADNFGTKNLYVGIDNNGDDTLEDSIQIKFGVYGIYNIGNESLADADFGVSDYVLFPGDEKAYVDTMEIVNENLNVTGAAEIIALRGFYYEGNCTLASNIATTILPTAPSVVMDLHTTNKEILDNRIPDLENGRTYAFMFGLEDKAGNIGLFKNLVGDCVNDAETVTPREVHGLLEDSQNCFITTAAFGSPLNAKVKTFKQFRDKVLNKFSVGQKLIQFYYKTSPPIAKVISESETLRTITRVLLWPAWALSVVVLYVGLTPVLLTITALILAFAFFRIRNSKKRKAAAMIIATFMFSIAFSDKALAQDDFFSTEESAPLEPPYTGTENDEFSEEELSELEVLDEPATSNAYDGPASPNKWKPYQRVPDEKRLEELSQRGLFKITKKGEYLYEVGKSPQNSAASFKVGTATFPNLVNRTSTSDIYFDEIYGTNAKPMLLVDYEWQFFQAFGKMGIKVGSGLMLASGKGQFDVPYQGSTDAKEKYNFFMFPTSLSLIYRMQLFNKQWLVPYGEAGVDYMAFVEARDDGEDIKFGGSPHFHFAVGGAFLLDVLGREMMAEVDRQYGINHMWLTAEYRRLESMGGDFDFSDDVINAGIMVEF